MLFRSSFRHQYPKFFYVAVTALTLSLPFTIWVGGVVTHRCVEALTPYLPRAVDLRRRTFAEQFLGTFRCQIYWLLATRAAWRVLWALGRQGHYDAGKTDRVTRSVFRMDTPTASRGLDPSRSRD